MEIVMHLNKIVKILLGAKQRCLVEEEVVIVVEKDGFIDKCETAKQFLEQYTKG